MSLYIVPQGKFFGYDFFMENNQNPNPGSGAPDPSGDKTEKMGMRALMDCSMYLLSESKILHLVRRAGRDEYFAPRCLLGLLLSFYPD